MGWQQVKSPHAASWMNGVSAKKDVYQGFFTRLRTKGCSSLRAALFRLAVSPPIGGGQWRLGRDGVDTHHQIPP